MRIPIFTSILLISGCAIPPGSMLVHLHAGAGINPVASGRAASVAITLYQLKSASNISRCNLYSLEQSATCFGDTLLEKQQTILLPAQRRDLLLRINRFSRLVIAVVFFRQQPIRPWLQVIRISPLMHWLASSAVLDVNTRSFSFLLKREGV